MLWQRCEVRLDVSDAIANWARWCRRVSECFPQGYACMSAEGKLWQPYRNADQSIEEKLELLREHQEPDELQAMQVERIVNALNRPLCVAIRIHHVVMPETDRHALGLDLEQWNERRARHATRRGDWFFTPVMYLDAVARATDEIEAAL